MGKGLLEGYGGQAVHLVHAAGGSAARLVELVTAAFPGFRDHCIYRSGTLQPQLLTFEYFPDLHPGLYNLCMASTPA